MSLYVYLVAGVTEEQGKQFDEYVSHMRSLSIFSSHRCWEEDCAPEGLPSLHNDKGEDHSICLGRPMCNEFASEMERFYGKQVIGENEFTAELLEGFKDAAGSWGEGPDEKLPEWIKKHYGQTVLVVNDNEY